MASILDVNDLRVYFHTQRGIVKAVDGVTFDIDAGERFGLIGESGSGKSTVALAIMRLIRPPGRIESGQIWLEGENLLELSEEEMRRRRLASVAMVTQGAMNSLNPVIRVRQQYADGLNSHGESISADEARARLADLLVPRRLGTPGRRCLPPPAQRRHETTSVHCARHEPAPQSRDRR